MLRVLFLPFLRMPSGHHQVADSLKAVLEETNENIYCEKVDILSYSYGNVESLVSSIYVTWINNFPNLYRKLYYTFSVKNVDVDGRFYLYERLFLKKMKKLVIDSNPDLVVCTHGLPSYLLARLKRNNEWSGIVINVYTDYFINALWGKAEIDFHFVPSPELKCKLIAKGISPQRILITGIPVHPYFLQTKNLEKVRSRYHVLICGGNLGVGPMKQFIQRLKPSGKIDYTVLCGKNEKLFRFLQNLCHPYITPKGFITDKKEMNELYDLADAVITKPGGATIMECIWKRLPIIVYDALPGQEEMNLKYLKERRLIYHLENWRSTDEVEKRIIQLLENRDEMKKKLNEFHAHLEFSNITNLVKQRKYRKIFLRK